jgi:lipopolysaccharide/colanic/teichoic acid biosynthesis glycosyltransferase
LQADVPGTGLRWRATARGGAVARPPRADARVPGVRSVDQAAALLVLALAALPMAAVALVLRATLGPPLFFEQDRVGLGGRIFRIRKFRTMRDDRDAAGVLLPDDERLTAISRIARRFRLDEAPQLLSIIAGEMAWVGPRPLLPATIEGYGALGHERCSVPPGLTGWAQVSGNTRLDDRQKLSLDLWYVNHRSALLDLRIVAATGWTFLVGERIHRRRLAEAEAHLAARGAAGKA